MKVVTWRPEYKEITEYRRKLHAILDVENVSIEDLRTLQQDYGPNIEARDIVILAAAHKTRITLGIRVTASLAWLYAHGMKPSPVTDADIVAGNYMGDF